MPRMAKAFKSGELTGKVVIKTKSFPINSLIIYPKGQARSLVIYDIDLSDVKGIGVFLTRKPLPNVNDIVKVKYDPIPLYYS